MQEHQYTYFLTTLGRELSQAISPPVPFDDASAHEAQESVSSVIGSHPTPETLAELTEKQMEEMAVAVGTYFECDTPPAEAMRTAVERILWHWPPRISQVRDTGTPALQ